MAAPQELKSRDEIQRAFSQLLRTHESRASQISTKAEEAERLKNREIVERAAEYTVESIVNSLAKLQLSFGTAVDEIADQLSAESAKLGEVQRAIEVESQRLVQLRNTIIAAESLAILKQDHQQKLAAFEAEAQGERKAFDEESAQQREEWQRELQEQEAASEEYDANLTKERQQAEEEHAYEAERQAKVQQDENAERRTQEERELAAEEASKGKAWSAREKVLGDAAQEIEELRAKVAGFADELEQASQKAREKAISAVNKEAKYELEMMEKDHASNISVYELKVQTLEDRIKRQAEQIAELSTKLDATISKSQSLAEQAFKSSTPSAGA